MVERSDGPSNAADRRTVFISIEGEATGLTAECGSLDTMAKVLDTLEQTHGRQDLRAFSISVEDSDDDTAATVAVQDALRGERRGRIHLHHCHSVYVAVEYNNESLTHGFTPASTVQRVLKWAVSPQGLNVEGDVHDLALQVAGTTVPLAPNVHIGTLLSNRRCELSLELVPKDRPQG